MRLKAHVDRGSLLEAACCAIVVNRNGTKCSIFMGCRKRQPTPLPLSQEGGFAGGSPLGSILPLPFNYQLSTINCRTVIAVTGQIFSQARQTTSQGVFTAIVSKGVVKPGGNGQTPTQAPHLRQAFQLISKVTGGRLGMVTPFDIPNPGGNSLQGS